MARSSKRSEGGRESGIAGLILNANGFRKKQRIMTQERFDEFYKDLTDDQLCAVVTDRNDLVPEAAAALDREVARRHLKPAPEPVWAGPEDPTDYRSLEEVPKYRTLVRTKWFLDRAAAPLIVIGILLGLLSSPYNYRNSEFYRSVFFMIFLAGAFWLATWMRLTAFVCPNCGERFGAGDKCRHCGLPRNRQR
jgi:hypothetical protein